MKPLLHKTWNIFSMRNPYDCHLFIYIEDRISLTQYFSFVLLNAAFQGTALGINHLPKMTV